jgi:hypothetical protein
MPPRRAAAARPPNVLITGTPGTGKTTLAEAVATASGLAHVDVGKAIREQELHSGWDEEFQCHIVDEDKARAAFCQHGQCASAPSQLRVTLLHRDAARRCALRGSLWWRDACV